MNPLEEKINVLMNMQLATLARQKVILNLMCHLLAGGDVAQAREIHAEACEAIDNEEKTIVEIFAASKTAPM